ncbi:MAG: hypothetical protein JW965_08630 [Bacteroidales bacterium]|nr:hypothetical protein [Bacteroidales bacterium]
MDLKSVINIILRDLKEAGDLIDDLKNKPKFQDLQIELARSKCKSAEELIKLIGDIITETGIEDLLKPVISESIADNDILEIQDKIDEEEEIEEIIEAEQSFEEQTEEKIMPPGEPDHSGETKPDRKSEQIIADRFSHLASRINEKVGDSKKTEGKTRTIPVTDLNRAIGINDRFYFIRELFNGKEESYRQTINSLNNVSSKEEAAGILREAVKEMADSEPAHQLLELVERKLSAK